MSLFSPDRPSELGDYSGPRIALIHGFAAREHMQRHLLKFLRSDGFVDTSLYGHRDPIETICDDLCSAREAGRHIAVIGFSQGGFHALKVAHALDRRGVQTSVLVMIAAGGAGRLMPAQWSSNPRQLPERVDCTLNYFSTGDRLGSDSAHARNLLRPAFPAQHVENVCFPRADRVSHLGLTTCYPAERVHPAVSEQLLARLHKELKALTAT